MAIRVGGQGPPRPRAGKTMAFNYFIGSPGGRRLSKYTRQVEGKVDDSLSVRNARDTWGMARRAASTLGYFGGAQGGGGGTGRASQGGAGGPGSFGRARLARPIGKKGHINGPAAQFCGQGLSRVTWPLASPGAARNVARQSRWKHHPFGQPPALRSRTNIAGPACRQPRLICWGRCGLGGSSKQGPAAPSRTSSAPAGGARYAPMATLLLRHHGGPSGLENVICFKADCPTIR